MLSSDGKPGIWVYQILSCIRCVYRSWKDFSDRAFICSFISLSILPLLVFDRYEDCILVLDRFHEHSVARNFLNELDDQSFDPFTWTHKQDGKIIREIVEQSGELEEVQTTFRNLESRVPVVGFYGFNQLNSSDDLPTLVDVGRSVGRSFQEIMEIYPNLAKHPGKVVLRDLKVPIEQERMAGKLPPGVKTIEHDFFTEQPVKGLFSNTGVVGKLSDIF